MKKLQIMAWVLSALLLTGCGGTGVSTKTAGEYPPQTTSADASGTTAAQNGNEHASEAAAQGQDEKPCASDAAPGQVTEKDFSAGDAKPAAGTVPAQEGGVSTPSKAGSAGSGVSDSAGNSSSKPAGNAPSAPAGSGVAGPGEEKPAPQPEEKGFDMDYWLGYAKDYAVSIGLRLDENAAESWDTPIRCSSKTEDVLAAYRNTAGAWDVALPAQMDARQAVSVEQDGYRLSFRFAGSLRRTPGTELYAAATDRAAEISLPDSVADALPLERGESIQTAAVRDARAAVDTVQAESSWDALQRQIRPEGMHSVVEYASIYENTDLKYDLTAEKLKESVIIRQKDEALLGYRYHLDSQGLRLL